MAGICKSVGGGVFLHATGVAVPVANIGRVKARVVNWKQVDVVASNRSGCSGKR